MNIKFKKEKYIQQTQLKYGWVFRVKIKENNIVIHDRSFKEKDYIDARAAYEAAKKYRNKAVLERPCVHTNVCVQSVLEESYKLYPLRADTIRKHKMLFNKYTSFQTTPIQLITAQAIQLELNEMIEIASDDTIQRIFSIWKRIYQTAMINDYVSKDITLKIRVPKSHYMKKRRSFSTDVNTLNMVIDLLLKQTHANKRDNKMICYALQIMYFTGMRPCECFALNKTDIDLDNMTINIDKELGSSLSKTNVIRQCKTDSSVRVIPISKELKPLLEEVLDSNSSKLLLPHHDGEYFSTNLVSGKITRLTAKYNLDFNMYQLRHQFSSDLITNNVDVRTVMELMGHNNTGMTIEYARSSDELKQKAIEKRK